MKKSISLLVSLVILSTGLLSSAQAQVEAISIRVDGLSCPFCAYGLEKKLKKIEGVDEVKINVDKGLADLHHKTGESIAVERLNDAVADAGFTPREITAIVVGTVEEHEGTFVLKNLGSDFIFILRGNDQLLKLRSELPESKKQVRVKGLLAYVAQEEHHGHPYTLTMERFDVIP